MPENKDLQGLQKALINFPASLLNDHWNHIDKDQVHVTCLHVCCLFLNLNQFRMCSIIRNNLQQVNTVR